MRRPNKSSKPILPCIYKYNGVCLFTEKRIEINVSSYDCRACNTSIGIDEKGVRSYILYREHNQY